SFMPWAILTFLNHVRNFVPSLLFGQILFLDYFLRKCLYFLLYLLKGLFRRKVYQHLRVNGLLQSFCVEDLGQDKPFIVHWKLLAIKVKHLAERKFIKENGNINVVFLFLSADDGIQFKSCN